MKKRFTFIVLAFAGLCASCTPPSNSIKTSENDPQITPEAPEVVDRKVHGMNIPDMSIEQALKTYEKILLAVPGTSLSEQKILGLDSSSMSLVLFLGEDGVLDAAAKMKQEGAQVNMAWISAIPSQWESVRTLPHLIER